MGREVIAAAIGNTEAAAEIEMTDVMAVPTQVLDQIGHQPEGLLEGGDGCVQFVIGSRLSRLFPETVALFQQPRISAKS